MKRFLLGLIALYQKGFSPILPQRCRFYPSCSEYARMSIEEKGILRGFRASLGRLLRCHPFSEGGIDYPL